MVERSVMVEVSQRERPHRKRRGRFFGEMLEAREVLPSSFVGLFLTFLCGCCVAVMVTDPAVCNVT